MALENIASRLTGYFPKLAKSEAYNLANDAWMDIRNDRMWSFQLVEDSVSTPNVINVGTFAVTQGQATITANAVASAAITGLQFPFITLRQFRVTSGGIYNIVAADFTVPTAAVLTLDRLYSDASAVAANYQIYQAYFAAPVPDFKRWLDWRDLTNGCWMTIYKTRREIDITDPQRLYFTFPYYVLPFGTDLRISPQNGSTPATPYASYGSAMFELYPNPLSQIGYQRWWVRTGADLVDPADTVPYPITDKLVLEKAKMNACQFSEANRDPSVGRGQAADYKFIYQSADAEYKRELKKIGLKDRDLTELFLSRIPRNDPKLYPYYSTITGRAYSGL